MKCYHCGERIEMRDAVWSHPPGTLGCDNWQVVCPGMWGAPHASPDVEIRRSMGTQHVEKLLREKTPTETPGPTVTYTVDVEQPPSTTQ